MNRLAHARLALAEALDPILSGRVDPYPLPAGAAAPHISIGQPGGARSTVGQRGIGIVATFPVTISYDGADRAQVAGLDDLVSRSVDAIRRLSGADVAGWRPELPDPDSPNRRSTVIEVDVTIAAATLCPPDVPGEATIPPQLMEV